MSASRGWFIVVNPACGDGRGLYRWRNLARALRSVGVGFEAAITQGTGEAEALAGEAVQQGFRRLLAVGGDGTLHEVVNGGVAAAAGRPLTIAVAPSGSGNDWARARRVPVAATALAAWLAAARTEAIDLGRIDFTATVQQAPRYFINVAGAGLDAHLIGRLPAGVARRRAYLLSLPRVLWQYRAHGFELRADGERQAGKQLLVQVANGPYCGGGMRLAAHARPDDGWLDLTSIAPLRWCEAMLQLRRLFDGRLAEARGVRQQQARDIVISADPAAAVQADGQLVGSTPVRISVVPSAIRSLV